MVTLQVTREPFAIDGINSETLNVNLNFRAYADTRREKARNKVLSDIKDKLLGTKNFNIETYTREGDIVQPNKVFRCMSFLQIGQPSPFENDYGEYMINYTVSGTMLVSLADGGAVMSNDIITSLTIGTIKGDLVTLSVETSSDVNTESLFVSNKAIIKPMPMHAASSWSITGLLRNTPIDNAIVNIISKLDKVQNIIVITRRDHNGKELYSIKTLFVGGKIIEQAGGYAQYQMALQREEIDE